MFLFYSQRYSNVRSYVVHHLVSVSFLFIGWIINIRQLVLLFLFINNVVIYFFLSIVKLSKILQLKRTSFVAFWTFFFMRNISKIIALRIAYVMFQQPLFLVQIIINALAVVLIIHNIYFTYVLVEMARKHYSFKSLRS